MPKNEDVARKLAKAAVTLICTHPFFATILMRMIVVEDPTASTAWVDGKHLGYNPAFVDKLSHDELVGVLAHEVLHIAGMHHFRRGSRDPRAWNYYADAVINHIVTEARLKLPEGGVPGVPDKAVEEIYVHPQDGGSGGGGGGGGGSDPGGCGEVRDAKNPDGSPMSEAEAEQAMQDTRVLVQQAVNAARAAGKLPAGLERFAEEAMEPRVPWTEILARFIDGQANNDYSFARPNRRFISQGIMMPSLWSPGYGKVILGCDTSGSIDQEQLKEICSEVLGCLSAYAERGQDAELTIAWFDHAVYPQTVRDASELKPRGGGGTSFRMVMEWLAESGEYPKALIMVTDGCCDDYGEAPPCPVLWVLTRRYHGFTPEFGEVACVLNE